MVQTTLSAKSINPGITRYLNGLQAALGSLPADIIQRVIDILFDAYQKENFIFAFGNGGSASTASHFMVDICKQTIVPGAKRIKALSISDNIPSMTAWANDKSYADIFVEQLKNLYVPGAVVIGISASGNSENVLRGIRYAKEQGSATIGFTGFDGGKLKDLADEVIIVPSNNIGQVEDVHLALVHLLDNVLHEMITSTV